MAAIALKMATGRAGVPMVLAIMMVVLGLSLAYAITVQQDYARAWQLQREFWADAVRAAPDLEQGTVVLVGGEGIEDSLQIGANTWAVPSVMRQLAHFPDDWSQPPRVFRLHPDWRHELWQGDGVLHLHGLTVLAAPAEFGAVDPNKVIVLFIQRDGSVARPDELFVGSYRIRLEGRGLPLIPALNKTSLWHLLLAEHPDGQRR
jgi:hypothetical protein